MANQKILDKKQEIINEIADKTKNSNSVIFFEYQGLTAMDTNALRRLLKETDSEFKIYKNTLVKRALDTLKIDITSELEGPKAVAFGNDSIAPIKVLSDFAKNHPSLLLKIGIVDGEITDEEKLKTLATIPSKDTLLTMLASGLMSPVRNLAIALDLRAKQLEEEK